MLLGGSRRRSAPDSVGWPGKLALIVFWAFLPFFEGLYECICMIFHVRLEDASALHIGVDVSGAMPVEVGKAAHVPLFICARRLSIGSPWV